MERIRHAGALAVHLAKNLVDEAIDAHFYPRCTEVQVNGMTVGLEVRSHKEERNAINLGGEGAVIESVLGILKPDDVFWDVGAGFGIWAVPMAKQVGHGGRVLAFEPHPDIAIQLRKNLDINCCPFSGEVVQAAAWNRCGEIDIHTNNHRKAPRPTEPGDLPLFPDRVPITITVPCITLAHFIEEEKRRMPKVLKIDVEGQGQKVVDGMGSIVRPEFVVYEQHLGLKETVPDLLTTEYHVFKEPFPRGSEVIFIFQKN